MLQLGPVLFHLIKVYNSWPQLCSMNAAYKRVDRQFGIADEQVRSASTQKRQSVTPKLGGSRCHLFYFDNLTQPIKAIYSNV
jgi:hypothetical protein